jgi:hypothetical protein
MRQQDMSMRPVVPTLTRLATTAVGLGALVACALLCIACSLWNQEGPDVTCADLDNGCETTCENGIVASCPDGKHVEYDVCPRSGGNGEADCDSCPPEDELLAPGCPR